MDKATWTAAPRRLAQGLSLRGVSLRERICRTTPEFPACDAPRVMNELRALSLLGLGALFVLPACGGGASGGGGEALGMEIVEVSNGFGRILPHVIAVKDAQGEPTDDLIEVTRLEQLLANATPTNPIRPPTEWPEGAVLPNNQAGNHFIFVRFGEDIDIESVLTDAATAGVDNNLTGNIQVVAYDPVERTTIPLEGRGFVGGKTFGPTVDPLNPDRLLLETWVEFGPNGTLQATQIDGEFPGLGFPGTESSFAGDNLLLGDNVFVFVRDTNGDLSAPYETFPTGVQVQMKITRAVLSTSGRPLEAEGLASTTVGDDTIAPEVLVSGEEQVPVIIPGGGEQNVDPETNIEITFTEPVQVLTVGDLPDGTLPALSASVQLLFGPETARVSVPFTVRPFSVFDLSRFELVPIYNFPGNSEASAGSDCGTFERVDIRVTPHAFQDLVGLDNVLSPSTFFETRDGPGIVNAPVTPDTIYIGRGGSEQGISVIDLNGFGGSTGDPTYDVQNPIVQGNSNFPNNPNVVLQGSVMIPPLTAGTCTFNGGSSGVFTLTRDTGLSDLLVRSPLIESVGDMAIGHSLDNTFNDAAPFGCQSGGGNICAATGLKVVSLSAGGPNSLAPSSVSNLPTKIVYGVENLVSWAPHPNPPPLVFPPVCLSPLINGLEPTSIQIASNGVSNLLVPGPNPYGSPVLNRAPNNMLATDQNSHFQGPDPSRPAVSLCLGFGIRQQIGHFLYVVDRANGEVVVFNSNRFTVIDRIRLPDPTSLAMSPNLNLLAVTNERADQVSFIDTDSTSSTFHQVTRTVKVGAGPTGIAWDPCNEDILVCNRADGTVSVISAFTLRVRKLLRNQISEPIEVAITPRQLGFGFGRGVYFAYILNQNGSVAVFESGPDGLNGWGFDDVIGTIPFAFLRPKTIQPDITRMNSAIWVVHENPLTLTGALSGQSGGALTNAGIASAVQGIIPLSQSSGSNPQTRNMEFGVFASIGEGPLGLSGKPVDIAFDNQVNLTALTNFTTEFSAGFPLSVNGKSILRFSNASFRPASAPQFMFLAVPNPGVVDVFDLLTGAVQRVDTNVFESGLQSIPAPNANVVVDFMRQ